MKNQFWVVAGGSWVVVSDSNGVQKREKYVKIRKKCRKLSFDKIKFMHLFHFLFFFSGKISTHSNWAKVAAVAADQSGSEGPFLRLIKMSEWSNHKTYTIALTNCCYAHMQTKSVESFSPTAECV